MPMLTGTVDAVIGVNTHRDTHTVAVVDPTGGLLASVELAADAFGTGGCSPSPATTAPAAGPGRSRAPVASAPG